MKGLEILLEINKKRADMLFNYKSYLKKIVNCIIEILKDKKPRIFLFGSALEGNLVAASDIDIMIVADVPNSLIAKTKILCQIEDKLNFPFYHPFEFHLLNSNQFKFYKKAYGLKLKELIPDLKEENKNNKNKE
ncbi:MAG: nucleotidyltransferase domain-containing protein [Promethearchaeia archaeon]